MKKNKIVLFIVVLAGLLTSCGDDYLTSYPSTDVVAGAPATIDVIEKNVTGAYSIMNFDDYANSKWMPVNMFYDVATDDIYAGGSDAGDQPFLQLFASFNSTPSNSPDGWWSIFYAGLKRCNGALDAIDNAAGDPDPRTLARLRAETLALRAYYVHWLWKAYGNIPYFDKAWTSEPFIARQHTFDEMYPIIIADLDAAIAEPELPMSDNTGRVTKSMAMMTKARVVMYYKDQSKYAEVLADMKTIINNGAFSLVTTAAQPNYTGEGSPSTDNPIEWIFLRDGEFCSESIFEVNCIPEAKSWGNAWAGYGNYSPRFTGARDIDIKPFVAGWGFCPVNAVTFNALFNEAGDYRKDATAIAFATSSTYQNTGLFLKKYIARDGYNEGNQGDRDLNYENNRRIYRIAEAYLNAAELEFAVGGGQGAAQPYLDAIRDRAFGDAKHRINATLNNIKRERHREFYGEGLRFWDLVRWGSDENGKAIKDVLSVTDMDIPISRVWDDTRKFLPISQSEIDKTEGSEFPLVQNPGY
ncbi:RagB/SusD family nutrient uptake outer membrane protein [Dysgonomonas sp. 521]|uniref:RagB/SusD family nutrient uptake outer membrane protein n=1 Tax=Dysgonomonas sp. 521 TaxID=2302932 RepID=UPI0013D1167F|nr:RagB/SusD family nutrient uptake outer membrane protein [Dysgonomonas sp. 521]NDV94562.1 RagB/SusD family nutrient uptake outer membrane protein [Dysgonomonas sp. 521]